MAISQDELDRFHRFASERLRQTEAELTLEDCLHLWRSQREEAETVAAIEQSLQDFAAGRYETLAEVDRELRRELGFPPPSE